jgi:hypothetical protein
VYMLRHSTLMLEVNSAIINRCVFCVQSLSSDPQGYTLTGSGLAKIVGGIRIQHKRYLKVYLA